MEIQSFTNIFRIAVACIFFTVWMYHLMSKWNWKFRLLFANSCLVPRTFENYWQNITRVLKASNWWLSKKNCTALATQSLEFMQSFLSVDLRGKLNVQMWMTVDFFWLLVGCTNNSQFTCHNKWQNKANFLYCKVLFDSTTFSL